jgi:stearoyl-CoA desaturase (delta-9 desaturase)
MNPYNQTLYVVWGNQILFVLGLIFLWSWWLIPLALLGLYVFAIFSEVSIHRYYTHKSYSTSKFKEKILRIFAILAGQGATISWVTVHRTHHAFEDTAKDPHSPLFHPWWKILLGLYPQDYKKTLVIDLMRSNSWKYFVFENNYYWLIWTAIWITSFLIHPVLFYFIVSGSAMWYLATSLVNILSHGNVLGTRKFVDAVATNSSLLNLITAIGHHNNHHKYPNSYTYSVNGEMDVCGYVIKNFLAIEKK